MRSPEDGATETAPASRTLPLQGGRNFRDLGGYPSRDGRRVRWGRLYRSGSMAELTPDDCLHLAGLGIRVVCDLRTTSERETAPSAWQDASAPLYWSRDYSTSLGELRRLFDAGLPSAEQMRELMLNVYRELPFEQAPAYRELFKRLVAGELPLIFNCAAGKDRTGIAAALILSALDVPRDVIVADYVLTNELLASHRFSRPGSLLGRLPADLVRAVMGSEPAYLDAAFASIEQRHGDVTTYLHTVLGVGVDELATLRQTLLDNGSA